VPLATALQVITSNPARILKLRGKGVLAAGADADIVLLDAATLAIDGVIAKGRWLMKARVPLARGTFERDPRHDLRPAADGGRENGS
jgi:beta-aspartyl-dipeptidase (metallo-type)